MNALQRDLKRLVPMVEAAGAARAAADPHRQQLHVQPPDGWLNDPNGLCQIGDEYHVFYQYGPFDPTGGVKHWGHVRSRDLFHWEHLPVMLYPDEPFDCHGVYSGSALVEDGILYLYYTGNVKHPGEYDYIKQGRGHNVCLATSRDAIHLDNKRCLMYNQDYPAGLTCHVRDPKVWKKDDTYYMIQGARTKNDVGQALIFESSDKINWHFRSRVESEKPFGYMWECPDYFETDGIKILSSSVQGLEGKEWADRNVYQSGYFLVDGDILDSYKLSPYHLWDYGFDYYAPQSFEAEDGRRIHISWKGMPDCEEYTNPTIKDGWQHCFTFPREVFIKDGKVCQKPVRELDAKKQQLQDVQNELTQSGCPVYEVNVDGIKENHFQAVLSDELILDYENGRFQMHFTTKSKTSVSAGRSLRYAEVGTLENVKILADTSSVEVFVNDGEFVFSTRYYPNDYKIVVHSPNAHITFDKIQ